MENLNMHLHTIYSDGTDTFKSLVDKLAIIRHYNIFH